MGRYYPYGTFCDKFGCWCDDVVAITDGQNNCNGDCGNCEYASEPERDGRRLSPEAEIEAFWENIKKMRKRRQQ